MEELIVDMSKENWLVSSLANSRSYTTIDCAPYHHDIVYIHKSNCPNCGGLLDGDELKPYTYCKCCGTKVWSEREVS